MNPKKFFSLIKFLLLSSCVALEVAQYRLPKTVLPVNYALTIQIDRDAFTTNIFTGHVNLTLNIVEKTDKIQLYSKELIIHEIILTQANMVWNFANQTFISDPVTDILTILCRETLSPGVYHLIISYEGKFSLYDLHGLYKSSYRNEHGVKEFLVATLFDVTYARKAFPCFDEPSFKATFYLSLVYPRGYNAIANSLPSEKTELRLNNYTLEMVRFRPTPIMQTYLNAFVISNYTCDSKNEDILFRACSRREVSSDRNYALEISPQILKFLENFTGIAYNISGIGKMDQVAIPEFSGNAMENWGLVAYRESTILWNPNESSNANKQEVAKIIAHEFSHMWFGNLVSLKWWSDLFLNEGFARYLEYVATAYIEPDWEMDKQFVIQQVHTALLQDSTKTDALTSPVTNSSQLAEKFGPISYMKGACIIRMIAHMMGLEQFRLGVQHYLQMNKFNNTEPTDLWNSLEMFTQLPFNFRDIVRNWTVESGYPVLNVRLKNSKTVVISQERFLLSGKSDTKYFVPITYYTNKDSEKSESTITKIWLTPYQAEIALNENIKANDWIILNNKQIGFYRTNYDEQLWDRIKRALVNTPNEIHVLNKAQIVDDLFIFAEANITTLSRVFDIISFLSENTEYYPWYSAFEGLSYLLKKVRDQDIRNKFSNFIIELMKKIYKSVPFASEKINDQIYTLKQAMVVRYACKLELTDCISNSKQFFSDYKRGITRNKNLKSTIFCTSLRHSDNIEEDWNFLWDKFRKTKIATEKITILQALGCTNNETILKRYLSYAVDENSGIHRQDSLLVFSSVQTGQLNGTNAILKFLSENFKQVFTYYGDKFGVMDLVSYVARCISRPSQKDEFIAFLHEKLGNEPLFEPETFVKQIDKQLDIIKRTENQLSKVFSKRK